MPKVEMRITVTPGEIKELVGDDGSVVIEGVDDPEFLKLLHALDKFVALRNLRHGSVSYVPQDPAENELVRVYDNIPPRLKGLLREHPLVG